MAEFVTGLTDLVTGIFDALVQSLASTGSLIFTVGTEGVITGVTPFGWLLVIIIAVPLATWAFGKLIGFIKSIRAK